MVRPGFTLIELLVVMAVIALLMGLVLPTLSSARDRGRAAACLSNQHQFAVAVAAYATDQGDRFPFAGLPLGPCGMIVTPQAAEQSWVTTLDSYASGDIETLARCPSDTSPYFAAADPATLRARSVSYGTNDALTGGGRFGRTDTLVQPAAVILAGELIERGSKYVTSDRFVESLWAPHEADEYPLQIAADRHHDRPHWVYVDGHAAAHAQAEIHLQDEDDQWLINRFRPELAR